MMRRLASWLWPDTLFGRLVLILVAGMFGGQLLTSTIWFELHDSRALDVPARLFASRVADAARLAETSPDPAATLARLDDARYRLQLVATPQDAPAGTLAQRTIAGVIANVAARRLGAPVEVRLLDAELRDPDGPRRGIASLFSTSMPDGMFHLQLKLPDGSAWLDARGTEGQAGRREMPGELLADYLVRIYLVRFTAVLLLALLAVRFAVRPLRQLASAAEALGRNVYRAPLDVRGPAEVRSAAQSFNRMQQRLIDGIAERTRFLAAVSHDLRSPLTRLRLRVEMLPDDAARERLRADLDDMDAMVRATLDVVQGVEIAEPRRAIDVNSLLDSLADDAREAGHAVTLEGRAHAPLPGYPRNLKRCLQNLLDNAIRYGERADIRVHDDGVRLRIAIADAGPGIPPELLDRVFEPYFRAEPRHDDSARAGTGLGLTIARSVAAAHGGTLVLRNRAEGGLEAVLELARDDAD